MNKWTVGIMVGVLLSLLTVPVWAQTANVSVTNNGASENTMASPVNEVLVMDFTLYVGNADVMVNNHDGTVNASPDDTVITTFPASLKFWDTDGNGYDPGDELYLDDDGDGVYTAATDTAINTDGTTSDAVGSSGDGITAGDPFTSFAASDNVFFQDDGDNAWEVGECIFLDGDGDTLLDADEQILNAGTVGNAGVNAAGSNLVYYDANGNGGYDDGEDIFDSSASRMTYSAAADAGINAGQDGSFDAPDGATLQQFTRTSGGYTALGLVDVDSNSTITSGDEVVDDIGGTPGQYDGGTDTLNAVTFKNQGTADQNDIAVKVYVDDGNGTWDAGDDDSLGTADWTTDSWDLSGLTTTITGGGTRFFVTATINAAAAIGHTIQMYVPQFNDANSNDTFDSTADEGFFLASKQDLPGSDVVNPNVQTIDAPVVNTDKNTGYTTIQAAINEATAGDMIEVHDSYDSSGETFPITVGTSVTIKAAAGANPAVYCSGSGVAVQITAADVVWDGVDLIQDPIYTGAGFSNNTGQDATIKNSRIYGFKNGVNLTNAAEGWTIGPNNTFEKNGVTATGNASGHGIFIQGTGADSIANHTITQNTFTDNGCGLRLTGDSTNTSFTGISILYNTFSNSTLNTGNSEIQGGGVKVEGKIESADLTIQYNVFEGNGAYGLKTQDGSGEVTATYNWWGDTTGPDVTLKDLADNADGVGDKITDQHSAGANPLYRPWLNADPSSLFVDSDSDGTIDADKNQTDMGVDVKPVVLGTGTTYYWTISDAIAAGTQTGSTIIVSDGTYAETITVDEDLTIKSVNGAASTIIEAGTNNDIITVNTGCDLTLGEAGAAKGFTIGFDADAVANPTADKIVHNGDVLNLYGNVIDDSTSNAGVLINSSTATGTIAGNTVQGCGTGIYFEDSGDFLVGGDTEAEGNTIQTNGIGVQIDSGSHTFKFNQFLSNTSDGVKITNAASAAGTVFHGTAGNKFVGNSNYAIENTSVTDVDAKYCYWGDATGPTAPSNTSGLGDDITAHVLYSPWLMSWPNGPLTSVYDTATHTFTLGYHDGYYDGWQLLSIPLNAADPSPEAVFDEMGTLVIYQYDECQTPSAYLRPTAVNPTGGYWVYFLGDKVITVEGATIQDQVTVTLGCAGWQMIGVPTVAIPITHNETDNPDAPDIMFSTDGTTWKTYAEACDDGWLDATTAVWRYDNSTGQYVGLDQYGVLDPWTGYWLKTAAPNVQMKVSVEYWLTHAPVPPSGSASYLPMSANADTPPAPPSMPKNLAAAMDKSGLIVYNEPNPIRDVHTTTFKVKGAVPIEAIRVEIFNQAGQLVFKNEQLGDELAWHTDNDYGEYLANGVYLYRVSAKISGQWVVTEVRKLAIFR